MVRASQGRLEVAPSEVLLSLPSDAAYRGFKVPRDQAASVQVHVPAVLRSGGLYVGSFTLRGSDGSQSSLELAPQSGSESPRIAPVTFGATGTAVIGICVGPKALAEKSNAWELVTHCSKMVVEVGGSKVPGVETSRFGQPIEIVALTPTGRTRLGERVSLLFYDGGSEAKKAEVEMLRPSGTFERLVTSQSGAAEFSLPESGSYRARLVRRTPLGERSAELTFFVPAK